MSLSIYSTRVRDLVPFKPLDAGKASLYVCGMTVYDLCHLGHARVMVAFDVVQRWLRASGLEVNYVRNITDIDDKIIARAIQNGESIRALTDRMIAEMHADADALGIERPTSEPRAMDYVPHMLDMIGALQAKGLAYQSDNGDVNYAVREFPKYGALSGKSLDELRAGERVAVAGGKADPLDFVLWKSAKAQEPDEAKWESPFGLGRPGWHIECSAMSCALLGEQFDIHGGGADLQFPHHENEIAQTEGVTGKPMAQVWMHNGFVRTDNEKMSKSLGNFFTIREVLKAFDAETVRFFIIRAHYRSPLNYSDAHLRDAKGALKRLYTALASVDGLDTGGSQPIAWDANDFTRAFKAAMDEDFGTPGAVAVLFDLAAHVNKTGDLAHANLLRQLGGVLGLLQSVPQSFLQGGDSHGDTDSGDTGVDVDALIAQRAEAKAAKNFALADQIRQDLLALGIVLKDSAAGTTWERA